MADGYGTEIKAWIGLGLETYGLGLRLELGLETCRLGLATYGLELGLDDFKDSGLGETVLEIYLPLGGPDHISGFHSVICMTRLNSVVL